MPMDYESLIEEGFTPQKAKEILRKRSGIETAKRNAEARFRKQDEQDIRMEYDYHNNPYADYEEDMGAPNGYLSDFSY